MEAAYVSVYLWKNTVEKAKAFDVPRRSRTAPAGSRSTLPRALVTIDGENHHITKTARIGEIQPDGLIYTDLGVPGPDRAGSLPEVLPVGRGSVRLTHGWMS